MSLEQVVGWTLIHSLWEIAAIAVLVLLANLVLRSASAKYLAACAALCACLLLPIGTALYVTMGHRATAPEPQAVASVPFQTVQVNGEPVQSALRQAFSEAAAPHQEAPIAPAPRRIDSFIPMAVRLWLLGAALMSFRLFLGLIGIRRMVGGGRTESARCQEMADRLRDALGVTRRVSVLISNSISVPATVGVFKAAVLLPAAAAAGLEPALLEALIAHELAHVRRFDYLVNLAQVLIETLLFYHPGVWWISRTIRAEREHCCDDLAIKAIGDKRTFARALAEMEELRSRPLPLAMAANGGPLLSRIRRLVVPQKASPAGAPWLAALLVLAVCGCLLRPVFAHGPSKANGFDRTGRHSDRISGRILTSEGLPAEGATIFWDRGDAQGLGETRADGDGRFEVAAAQHRLIVALFKGREFGGTAGDQVGPTRVIKLHPLDLQRIRCVDDADRPMPNLRVEPAQVQIYRGVMADFPEILRALSAMTDRAGEAAIPRTRTLVNWIQVESDRYAVDREELAPFHAGIPTVVVGQAYSVSGVVTAAGRPLQGALVAANANGRPPISTGTDSKGAYLLKGLAKGRSDLDVSGPGTMEPGWVFRAKPIHVSGNMTGVNLSFERGALLQGRVVDTSGNPISGASVWFQFAAGEYPGIATGLDGSFKKRLPSGDWTLKAGKGLKSEMRTVRLGGAVKVSLHEGEVKSIELKIPTLPAPGGRPQTLAHHISGLVLDSAGRPAAGAKIHEQVFGSNGSGAHKVVTEADSAGRFEIALENGQQAYIVGLLDRREIGAAAAGAGGGFTLKLKSLRRIRVRAVDKSGRAVPGIRVGPGFIRISGTALTRLEPEFVHELSVPTDSAGYAVMVTPEDAPYGNFIQIDSNVYAVAGENGPNYPSFPAKPIGSTPATPTVVVTRGYEIQGAVTADGKPMPDVNVIVRPYSRPGSLVRTDSNGRFDLRPVAPGNYELACFPHFSLHGDWVCPPRSIQLKQSTQGIELKLEHGAELTVHVRDGRDRPLPKAVVMVQSDEAKTFGEGGQTNEKGNFADRLPHGSYEVRASGAVYFGDGKGSSQQVNLRNGETKEITLRIPDAEPSTDVKVQVYDVAGRLVEGQWVFATSGPATTVLQTNEKGEGSINVPASKAPMMTFRAEKGDEFSAWAVAPVGDRVVVKLHHVNLVTVWGLVCDSQGRPIRGAKVTITVPTAKQWTGEGNVAFSDRRTGTDGRYEFQGLYPGNRALLMVEAPGFADAQKSVQLPEAGGEVQAPSFRIPKAGLIVGKLLDGQGQPIRGADVWISEPVPANNHTHKTDVSGRFSIDSIPPGGYRLSAWARGHRQSNWTVKTGTDRVYYLLR